MPLLRGGRREACASLETVGLGFVRRLSCSLPGVPFPMKPFSERQWLVLLLASLQFIILSDYLIVMPMGPILMETFSIRTGQFAGLISIYSIGAIVIAFTTAGWLDRFDRMRSLQVALICFLGISALHGLVDDFRLLGLLRFLAGGVAGLIGSLVMSVVTQTFPSNRRGRVIGIVLSATSVCQIVGIPAGLFLMAKLGWKAPFLLNSVLALLVLIPLLRLAPGGQQTLSKQPLGSQMLRITRERHHFKAMLCTLLTMLAGSLVVPFLPLLLVYRFGVPENELSGVYLVAGLVAFVASLLAGKLAERGDGRFGFSVLGLLGVLPLLMLAGIDSMPRAAVVAVFALGNALLIVRMIPMNRFIMEYIHPELLGGFQSVNTALMHVGASSAAAIGGLLISVNEGELAGFGSVVAGSIAVLMLVLLLMQFGFRGSSSPTSFPERSP